MSYSNTAPCTSCSKKAARGTVGIVPLIPEATSIISTAGSKLVSLIGGGSNPRAGGADPCCPPGYNPPSPWPRNSGQDGAPPDYRTRGSPMEDPSPSPQGGRLKDDFCDCIPIYVNGKYWMVGSVANGVVKTGLPANRDSAVWVAVSPVTKQPVFVPGFGAVGAAAGGAGGTSTGAGGAATLPAPVKSAFPALLGVGVIAALLRAKL